MKCTPLLFCLISWLSGSSQVEVDHWNVSNAGEYINSEYNDYFPMIMPDGLTIYFSSDRPGGLGELDIYVSKRKSVDASWEEPINLGPNINSPKSDHSVTILNDGLTMIYTSERIESTGTADLYISNNDKSHDAMGWKPSINTGKVINVDSAWTACPLYVQDRGLEKIFFTSNRSGDGDAYVSIYRDGKFEKPTKLGGIVNTDQGEMHFDPVEGYIWTNRMGGLGNDDIWIASDRKSDIEWSTVRNAGDAINTPYNEGMPCMTHDKSLLFFHSDRPHGKGKYDIYFAAKPSK